jgi:heme exporter protein D
VIAHPVLVQNSAGPFPKIEEALERPGRWQRMLESLSRALSSLTTHARIVLLVGVSATPALAISVYHGLEERRLAIAHARDDLARTARIAAAQQEQLLAGVRQLLRALASGIARELARDPDACRAFFKRLVAESEGLYHTMGVLSAEGEMLCNALPWESRVEASDRRYFTLALETRTFAVGTYQIGRVTRRPAVDFGHPFSDGSDSLGGVVFAELDLE